MKKILISTLAVAVFAGVYGWADSPGGAPVWTEVVTVAAPTGGIAAVSVTTSLRAAGYLDGVYLDFGGTADASGTVSIATSASYGDLAAARTILSKTYNTAPSDGYLPIRIQAYGTDGAAISGVYLPITLFNEFITLSCTNWSTTGATVRAVFCTSPPIR